MRMLILGLSAILLTLPMGGYAANDVDNTGINERDRGGQTLTPDDQSESASDRTISQEIRKAVEKDSTLSINAKNVKIITRDGVVTLRGPVNNENERQAIEKAARQVSGVRDVRNQIDVSK